MLQIKSMFFSKESIFSSSSERTIFSTNTHKTHKGFFESDRTLLSNTDEMMNEEIQRLGVVTYRNHPDYYNYNFQQHDRKRESAKAKFFPHTTDNANMNLIFGDTEQSNEIDYYRRKELLVKLRTKKRSEYVEKRAQELALNDENFKHFKERIRALKPCSNEFIHEILYETMKRAEKQEKKNKLKQQQKMLENNEKNSVRRSPAA